VLIARRIEVFDVLRLQRDRKAFDCDNSMNALRPLEQAAFMRSQLAYRNDYSTLLNTVEIASESSTA
jgi:hypothetical protein